MIEDLRRFETAQTLSFDLCVVGAGPAGISIAHELIGSGIRVCLIESGGYEEEPNTQALYEGESIGHPVETDEGRYRVFGGSATRWIGRCTTLDAIDFEKRSWVQDSGWPISLSTLKPYYERAKVVCNFGEPWLADQDVPKALGIALPALDLGNVNAFIWRFAPASMNSTASAILRLGSKANFDWRAAYGSQLRADPNTLVLLHANLTELEEGDDGATIAAVRVSSLDDVSLTVKARAFVFCCGGIENARILLAAPTRLLARVNKYDSLGRYLTQHPRGCMSEVRSTPQTALLLQETFARFSAEHNKTSVDYEVGFALSERAQREHQLLNASASVTYEAGSHSPWASMKRLRDAVIQRELYRGALNDAYNVARSAGSVAKNVWQRTVQRRQPILANPLIRIIVDLEQQPIRESRITLSDKKNAFGMRKIIVDWRISEKERTTARYFNGFISDELRRLGFGETISEDWLTSGCPITKNDLKGTYHFIGTTRMSKSPREGVVDADCRAHGVENLYVAGCSVFSTGGHANPTLTIVALAIRLADHLRSTLKN